MICPNCGESLPDTATMCHTCKIVFATGKPMEETASKPSEKYSNYYGERPYSRVQNSFLKYADAVERANSLFHTGMSIGMLGGAIGVLALFFPFYSFLNIVTVTLIEEELKYYGLLILLIIALGVVYASRIKKGKGSGLVLTGFFIIGVDVCVFLLKYFEIQEKLNSKGGGNVVAPAAGFYTLLLSGLLFMTSGIIAKTAYKKMYYQNYME
jgi:hypothetical protein